MSIFEPTKPQGIDKFYIKIDISVTQTVHLDFSKRLCYYIFSVLFLKINACKFRRQRLVSWTPSGTFAS